MMAQPVAAPQSRRAPYRFSADDVIRMYEAGILPVDLRAELIEGQIIDLPSPGSPHASAVDALNEQLVVALHGQAIVRVQNPLRLDDHNEPHPDLAVVRLRTDRYGAAHPGGDDALLVIEVCDTSHWYDRKVKLPIYARAGVPEFWIVDLPGRRIEVYRDPRRDRFASTEYVQVGDRVTALLLPRLEIDTESLFL